MATDNSDMICARNGDLLYVGPFSDTSIVDVYTEIHKDFQSQKPTKGAFMSYEVRDKTGWFLSNLMPSSKITKDEDGKETVSDANRFNNTINNFAKSHNRYLIIRD